MDIFTAFGVAIQLIILFFISLITATALAVAAYLISSKKQKRKTLVAFLSPFIFLFTFYICAFIGSLVMSSIMGTGMGTDGYWCAELSNGYKIYSIDEPTYGDIEKGETAIGEVSALKEVQEFVYGKRASKSPLSEWEYFSLNTATGELNIYNSLPQAREQKSDFPTDFLDTESFYYNNWRIWWIPVGILSLLAACGSTCLTAWIIPSLNIDNKKLHTLFRRNRKAVFTVKTEK